MTIMPTLNELMIQQIAKTAHSVNATYCASLGDLSQMPWDEAPDNIQASAVDGVRAIMEGRVTSPEQSHYNWRAFKEADGWVYGPTKDLEAKTHPNLIEGGYDALPESEKTKDALYFAVVLSFL